MAVSTYTKTGTKAATPAKLPIDIFGLEVNNHELIKQAYDAYLSNGRKNLAVTKTRGLVRGGGRKPWRQKGTGRARFGSSRNPIWRGGGIVFGPTGEENYAKKLSPKATKKALKQALSFAANEDRIKVIENFECKDAKVAASAKLLAKLDVKGNVLVIVSAKDKLIERATNNLSAVKVVSAKYLNAVDLTNADTIVITEESLKIISDWLKEAKK